MELNSNLNFSSKTVKYNIVIYFYISAQDIWFWWSESKVLFFLSQRNYSLELFLKGMKGISISSEGEGDFLGTVRSGSELWFSSS